MPLVGPGKHEPLAAATPRDDDLRAKLDELRRGAEAADRGAQFWLEHPTERDLTEPPTTFLRSLYFGAAGTLWALRDLGSAVGRPERAAELWSAHLAVPDAEAPRPGLLLGDLGVALVCWLLAGEERYLDLVHEAATAAIGEPELELLWGAPGALHAARFLAAETGDPRWVQLGRRAAEHLLATWEPERQGARLWTQDLYGRVSQILGAGHGFAGNAGALLSALPWLPAETAKTALDAIAATTIALADRSDGGANWKTHVQDGKPAGKLLVQWCHGAPGFLTALARYPVGYAPELEKVFLEAGALIWDAGPLAKPFGLCHGTAGNAYAFLVLFHRTGDELWLERAKRFAAHAVRQSGRELERYGFRRWSFLTGDLGLAVLLNDSLTGRGERFPGIDRY